MSDMLRTYWANFAQTGNPNGPGIPAWPAFGKTTPRMRHIASENTKAVPIVSEDGLRALDEYFAWPTRQDHDRKRSRKHNDRGQRPRHSQDSEKLPTDDGVHT